MGVLHASVPGRKSRLQSIINSFIMNHKKKYSISIISLAILSAAVVSMIVGCIPQEQQSLNQLFSPTPSLTTTPTIQWFPATATPMAVAQSTATPDPANQLVFGQPLFADTFTGGSNWQDSQTQSGIVTAKDGAITLAVKTAQGSLVTLRENTLLNNFYLETTVKRVAFCNENDQIGVLFRAQDAQNFYRVMINCQGTVALQQMVGGTPTMLVDWKPSSQVPSGLWMPFKIGIWTYGRSIRVYINDQLFLDDTRDTFASGGIGFSAKAVGDTPLTVSFSELNVYQVDKPVLPQTTVSVTP